MLDHHWQFVQVAMENHHRVVHNPAAIMFAEYSMGHDRLAYLAKAACECQRDEEAALIDTKTGQRLTPFNVLSMWMEKNEQGCRDWVNAQPSSFFEEPAEDDPATAEEDR